METAASTSKGSPPNRDDFSALAGRAYEEFSELCDYIWKSPRLLDAEMELELGKLDSYFPISADADRDAFARQMRLGVGLVRGTG